MFQQNQDIFNILSEALSEGVIIVDKTQKIVGVNSSANEMFGYEGDELSDQPLHVLIPQKYHAAHGGHVNQFMKKSAKRRMGGDRELYGIKKSGNTFPVEVGLNPFHAYGNQYIMALVVDITERKNYTDKLEQTVALRTKELQLALAKEKELNELKTKFLSLVSHEFKTPLSGILTSTILLEKYKLTEQQEKRDKHIKTISSKVHYLNNILNDFLSIERLDTGKVNYNFKDFNLSKVVNEVLYGANMLLKEGQHIIIPENIDEFNLHQDEKILELAISNLIHNAIKYSSENTTVTIEVEKKDEKLIFKVRDEGRGIPEKDQKHIFNRYFRAENALNDQGTGIGLNIVKGHLESLGGSIQFESKENEGSLFVVELPITHKG